MNCAEIKELLPLYLSGELSGPDAAEFAAHLRDCPNCAWEAQRQAQLDEFLREEMRRETIEAWDVERDVLAQIRLEGYVNSLRGQAPQPRNTMRRALATGALAAAILVLAVLGIGSIGVQRSARAYSAVALDHQREVVEQQPRPWLVNANEITQLAGERGVPASALHGLTAQGYRLVRGKLCKLDGTLYVHLVYSNGSQQLSAFFRADGQRAAGDTANGGPHLVRAKLGTEHLARFDAPQCHAFFVSNESNQDALRIADAAASGM